MIADEAKLVAEFTVPAADGGLLTELVDCLAGDDVAFGPQRDVAADSQLYLDFSAVAEAVKSVTAVISGLGGAAKVVELLITWVKRSPQRKIAVNVGSTSVTVSGDGDPDEIRSALRATLKLV